MHLILRYNYSVQEVWGPFTDERAAEDYLNTVLVGQKGMSSRTLALKEIDHPTSVCPGCGRPKEIDK